MSSSRGRGPNVLQRPEQGWTSLLLLMTILVLVAISVTNARLFALGDSDPGGALVVLMLAAGSIGYVLARSTLGVVRSHLLGAGVGATVLLLYTGAALQPDVSAVPESWAQLREIMVQLNLQVGADLEASRLDEAATLVVVPYLVLGGICWTTAQFSAFSVFRYDRGGPAVMATGAVLFLNIGLEGLATEGDRQPPLLQLAAFSALAMLLLMRLQLTHQGYQWARRHIADTGEVARLFLRTGTAFVLIAVVGASALTITASGRVDPPTDEFEDMLDSVGRDLTAWLPKFINVPQETDGPRSIDDGFRVPQAWPEGEGTAFTALVPGGLAGNYWFLRADDRFDGWDWDTDPSDNGFVPVAADSRSGIAPRSQAGQVRLEASIDIEGFPFTRNVLSPVSPTEISADAVITTVDAGDSLGEIEFKSDSRVIVDYDVVARAWAYDGSEAALTARELNAAEGKDDGWLRPRYTQGAGSDRSSGPKTRQLASTIERRHETRYERALAVQNRLRNMKYSTNLGSLCEDLNVPECTLTFEEGFCQYYASTMVMVLREMDIPSRIVQGYLPGEPQSDGSLLVEQVAFHAWVEVHFPDIGWIRFDPTPGTSLAELGSQGTDFAPGEEDGGVRPGSTPAPPRGPEESFGPEPTEEPVEPGCVDCPPDEDQGALIGLIIGGGLTGLLLVGLVGLLLYRLRRLPGGSGALAYSGIVSLATRLGYGPHPSQTEYEYASSLADTLPSVREDLYVVADSRVETTYGRHVLDAGRQGQVRRAYRRIRTALLRLSLGRRRSP